MSSNIVGYEKVTLAPGYNMIGVQFNQVGGEALPLATVGILDSSMAGFDEDGNYATELMVWDGRGYGMFGWSGSSGTDVLDDDTFDNQWLDDQLEKTDEEMIRSSAAWVKAGSAGTITISGEVPTEASIDVSIAVGYNMVANPYPGTKSVATFGILDATVPGFDEDGNYAVEMLVWDGRGYASYGWAGSSGTDVLDDPTYDNQWLDDQLEKTDATIDFGHGVWIKSTAAGTLTFSSPQ